MTHQSAQSALAKSIPRKKLKPACLTAASAVAVTLLLLLGACASRPPPPDWQVNAQASMERSMTAYLEGNARVEVLEFERARNEVARTGRTDLLARIELMRCAGRVASLVVADSGAPCPAFELLRADAPVPDRAYAHYLSARLTPSDVALLPPQHRSVARIDVGQAGQAQADVATATALRSVDDPLARLVAAGVLFQRGQASPAVVSQAVDTASAQGWRRPLLAWLQVQLQRVEAAGDIAEAERLRRRISLIVPTELPAAAALSK